MPEPAHIVHNAWPEDTRQWFVSGFDRQDKAIIGALVAAWTGLPFALYLAAVGFFVGAVVGFIGTTVHASSFGIFGTIVGSPGGGLLGALVGAFLGAAGGFLLIYYYLATHPLQLVGSLIAGAIISFGIFFLMAHEEFVLLRLRGYRQPSRREREKLSPLLQDVGAAMGFQVVPSYWIDDRSKKPGAWMHLGAIVLTRGLLGDYDASEEAPKPDLDDAALSAILAHELTHWQRADVVGLTMVSACFFPFVCITNAIRWIRLRAEWTGVILWCFLWPIWICGKLVVTPLMAWSSRDAEFEADRSAARLGDQYRLGLRRALTELSTWEPPRTGWEDVISATHPPMETRLEFLEARAMPVPVEELAEAATRGTRPRRTPTQPVAVSRPPQPQPELVPVETKPTPRKQRRRPPQVEEPATEVDPHDNPLEKTDDEYLKSWTENNPPPDDDDGQWSVGDETDTRQ